MVKRSNAVREAEHVPVPALDSRSLDAEQAGLNLLLDESADRRL